MTSLGREIAWRLEAFAYDLFEGMVRLAPIDAASDFGAGLFRLLGPLSGADRVMRTNMRIAFPEATAEEIDRLAKQSWGQLGRWFAEFPIIDRIVAEPERVEIVGGERLAAIAAGAGPAVFVSGHFSAFEVMPAVIVRAGTPCQVTYRAANNPYVDARIRASRFRYGVRMFAPKGSDGARELLRALGRGESVALMNDQKFNGGVAAPLFGVMAHTAPGPSSFALRFDAPIVPMSVERKAKARFRVIVHEPIRLENTGDRTADIEAGVRRINAFIEDRVRARPTEWFWVHKRWPSELYKR